jgi:hypothetical protein
MGRTMKTIALAAGAAILFFFALFVVNQTAQVVELSSRLSPAFGNAVLWFLLALYSASIIAAALFFLRLPRPLRPPELDIEPQISQYLEALRKRLSANPRLKGCDLSSREKIEKALELLGRECDVVIRESAAAVFLSTAISQSGRLDTIFVLATHGRMVWRIAGIYYQRPPLRELLNLYANVAATAFMAGELDDAEISEQIEPILSSAFGALSLSLPGVQAAASIVVDSVFGGAANAFLTLRVGIIARRYCASLVRTEPRNIRRAATVEAARMLGGIVRQGTAKISRGLWNVSKNKMGGAFSGVTGLGKNIGDSLLALFRVRKGEDPCPDADALPKKGNPEG